jgi:hypothetical protein
MELRKSGFYEEASAHGAVQLPGRKGVTIIIILATAYTILNKENGRIRYANGKDETIIKKKKLKGR